MLDFAGGTVVHINAGIAGLVCCLVLGKRIGYGQEPMAPHNLVLTLIGTSLLWVGWFGFNAGSALAAGGRAGMAFAVTHIGAASAAIAWMLVEWVAKGKPSLLGIASGAVAGLVAITPAVGLRSAERRAGDRARRRHRLLLGARPRSSTWSATTTRSTCSACTASAASSARMLTGVFAVGAVGGDAAAA